MRTKRNRIRALLPLLLATGLPACGGARAQHLILITVDTLRADHLGVYGHADAETPVLDALAARSIRFERAYAHASLTEPSVASLLTGRLPGEHGVHHNQDQLEEGVATLAEILHEAGFATGAFVGSYVLRRGHGFERGFDAYTDDFVSKEMLRPVPENPAGVLTDQALEWAEQQQPGRRLFLWIHYQEPHGPYTPGGFHAPPQLPSDLELPRSASQSGLRAIPRYQWVGHGRLGEYLLRYDREITAVDWFVGVLERGLERAGVLDDSVVVFTADHGEAFGEDDLYCTHGEGLGEALLRVPLLLSIPGEPAAVREDVVRQIDLLPTVLSLLGLGAGDAPGESLLRDRGDRRVVSQALNLRQRRAWRGIRDGGVEIVQRDDGPVVVRRRTRDGASAGDVPPGVLVRLDGELDRLAPWPEKGAVPLSPKEREALRSLGYAE